MRSLSTWLLLCGILCPSISENWCNHTCGNEKHLRCEHKVLTSNPNCPKIETGLSPYDRMRILDAHNRWRDYVASGLGRANGTTGEFWLFRVENNKSLVSSDSPGQDVFFKTRHFLWRDDSGQAADMRQLVWDYELERNAAIWASQCKVEASLPYQCAGTSKFKHVHMNMYFSPKPYLEPTYGFDGFLRHISYVDNYYYGDRIKVVRSYSPGVWDPFYALIYSQTYAIGCSKGLCHCGQDPLPYGESPGCLTCIYGPSFDKTDSGYEIYRVDQTRCSMCPNGTACRSGARYKYLCARPEDPEQPAEIPDGVGQCLAIKPGTVIIVSCALVILRVTL